MSGTRERAARPVAWPSSRRGASSAPVLIVDDTASKRLALKAALAPLGHRIVEADSGVAALRCVLEEDFAVILLDVTMPGMDGFETAALIRQRRESEMTPIIFVTAYSSDDLHETDHYAGGAVDFLFAPVPPAELRSKVSFFAHVFLNAEFLAARARDVQAAVDQLRFLTDAAPIGIFQTDAENRYVYTNARWSEITEITADEAVGAEWDSIVDPQWRADLPVTPTDSVELSHRFEISRPGSELRLVLATSRAIPDGSGGRVGWVGTLADVTAETRERALAEARDRALSASATQRAFAASASHELRTPTTSIIGWLEEVLESVALGDEDRGFVEIAYRNAQRLSRLIDDLLILDQTESGPQTMHLESTLLRPLTERVISSFAADAERAGIRLSADSGTGDPAAHADPLRLEQVITNLVSNALKYTPSGGEVLVQLSGGDETVEVSVTDDGAGIEPDDIDKIFDRFYRTQTAANGAVKGSGLGLAIARAMIESQNGHLRAASAFGVGSTFTITLPAAALVPQAA